MKTALFSICQPVAHRRISRSEPGRWAIGVCKRLGLLELAHVLVTPGIITEMKVKRALNLDGGHSTGLWCQNAAGTEHFEKPGWAVRNALVVLPRVFK